MKPCCEITLEIGDGEHVFSLPLGAIRELEAKRDVGVFRMRQRLFDVAAQSDFRQRVIEVAMSGVGTVAELRARIITLVMGAVPVVPTADTLVEADIYEILRCGLIGGGKTPAEALAWLRANYYPARPLEEFIMPALAVVNAAVQGAPGHEFPKSREGAETQAESAPSLATDASTSSASTNGAPHSASPPSPSTPWPTGNSSASSPDGSPPIPPTTSPSPPAEPTTTG